MRGGDKSVARARDINGLGAILRAVGGAAESVEYNIKIMYIAAIIARSGATKHAMGALQPVERWLVRCGCDDGLRCEPFATGLILPFERGLQEGDFVGRQVEQPIDDCVDLALRRGYLVR